jgi:hypothetical protein
MKVNEAREARKARKARKASAVLLAFASVLLMGAMAQQSADETEIRRVVTDYYFNHNTDTTLLRQAFDTQRAHMFYVQADTLVDVPIPVYIQRAGSGRPRPAGTPDPVAKRVVMVDVSGTAAVAKLELRGPNGTLIDYMSLLKVGGRWQIVNKIFSR